MRLLQESKNICLEKIAIELPNLLAMKNLQIKLSGKSQNELITMIQKQVELKYYSGDLGMENGAYAISLNENCSNSEIAKIPALKVKLLDMFICSDILEQYRDDKLELELIKARKQPSPYYENKIGDVGRFERKFLSAQIQSTLCKITRTSAQNKWRPSLKW